MLVLYQDMVVSTRLRRPMAGSLLPTAPAVLCDHPEMEVSLRWVLILSRNRGRPGRNNDDGSRVICRDGIIN
jgi:hypothetical protein